MKLDTTSKDFQVGQIIWLIPVQNSITRGKPLKEQLKEVTITKVGKTQLYINDMFIKQFNIYGEQDKNNYGYLPFVSKEKALEYLELKTFISNIKNFNFSELTQDKIKKLMIFFKNNIED